MTSKAVRRKVIIGCWSWRFYTERHRSASASWITNFGTFGLTKRLPSNDLSVEAHIGRYASEIDPGLAKIVVPMMAQVLASKQPLLNVEITSTQLADVKRERTWMVNFHPVTNSQTFGVSVVFQDITVLKETEDICTRFGLIVRDMEDTTDFGIVHCGT